MTSTDTDKAFKEIQLGSQLEAELDRSIEEMRRGSVEESDSISLSPSMKKNIVERNAAEIHLDTTSVSLELLDDVEMPTFNDSMLLSSVSLEDLLDYPKSGLNPCGPLSGRKSLGLKKGRGGGRCHPLTSSGSYDPVKNKDVVASGVISGHNCTNASIELLEDIEMPSFNDSMLLSSVSTDDLLNSHPPMSKHKSKLGQQSGNYCNSQLKKIRSQLDDNLQDFNYSFTFLSEAMDIASAFKSRETLNRMTIGMGVDLLDLENMDDSFLNLKDVSTTLDTEAPAEKANTPDYSKVTNPTERLRKILNSLSKDVTTSPHLSTDALNRVANINKALEKNDIFSETISKDVQTIDTTYIQQDPVQSKSDTKLTTAVENKNLNSTMNIGSLNPNSTYVEPQPTLYSNVNDPNTTCTKTELLVKIEDPANTTFVRHDSFKRRRSCPATPIGNTTFIKAEESKLNLSSVVELNKTVNLEEKQQAKILDKTVNISKNIHNFTFDLNDGHKKVLDKSSDQNTSKIGHDSFVKKADLTLDHPLDGTFNKKDASFLVGDDVNIIDADIESLGKILDATPDRKTSTPVQENSRRTSLARNISMTSINKAAEIPNKIINIKPQSNVLTGIENAAFKLGKHSKRSGTTGPMKALPVHNLVKEAFGGPTEPDINEHTGEDSHVTADTGSLKSTSRSIHNSFTSVNSIDMKESTTGHAGGGNSSPITNSNNPKMTSTPVTLKGALFSAMPNLSSGGGPLTPIARPPSNFHLGSVFSSASSEVDTSQSQGTIQTPRFVKDSMKNEDPPSVYPTVFESPAPQDVITTEPNKPCLSTTHEVVCNVESKPEGENPPVDSVFEKTQPIEENQVKEHCIVNTEVEDIKEHISLEVVKDQACNDENIEVAEEAVEKEVEVAPENKANKTAILSSTITREEVEDNISNKQPTSSKVSKLQKASKLLKNSPRNLMSSIKKRSTSFLQNSRLNLSVNKDCPNRSRSFCDKENVPAKKQQLVVDNKKSVVKNTLIRNVLQPGIENKMNTCRQKDKLSKAQTPSDNKSKVVKSSTKQNLTIAKSTPQSVIKKPIPSKIKTTDQGSEVKRRSISNSKLQTNSLSAKKVPVSDQIKGPGQIIKQQSANTTNNKVSEKRLPSIQSKPSLTRRSVSTVNNITSNQNNTNITKPRSMSSSVSSNKLKDNTTGIKPPSLSTGLRIPSTVTATNLPSKSTSQSKLPAPSTRSVSRLPAPPTKMRLPSSSRLPAPNIKT